MECKCSAEMGINMHKQNDITKVSGHRHSGKVQCKASVREPVIAQKISRKLNTAILGPLGFLQPYSHKKDAASPVFYKDTEAHSHWGKADSRGECQESGSVVTPKPLFLHCRRQWPVRWPPTGPLFSLGLSQSGQAEGLSCSLWGILARQANSLPHGSSWARGLPQAGVAFPVQ